MAHPRHPKISRTPADVPQKTCTWLVAVRPLALEIPIDTGEIISPYIIIIADVTQEIFVSMVPSEKRPTAAEVGECLFNSMVKPTNDEIKPYRPERVEFEQAELVGQFSAALWELQITAVAGQPNPIIDEVVSGLNTALGGKMPEPPGLLSIPGVTHQMIERLLEASGPFYRLAPWHILTEIDALLVRFEPSGEQRFVQLMGDAGIETGLVLYQRWEHLLQFYVPTDDPMTNLPEDGLHALNFVDKDELPSEDQQAIQRYRWKGAQKKIYPMPLILKPETTQRPDRQEILFYEALMRAIPILIEKHLQEDPNGEYQPFQAELEVSTADGPMRLSFTYPAGEFPEGFFVSDEDEEDWEDEEEWEEEQDETEVHLPLTPAQQKAADLTKEAWGIESDDQRRELAQQAIQAAPDHPEAYLILGEMAETSQESIRWYREGIQAGEKLITQEWVDQAAGGEIWRIPEGETLMILRRNLADELIEVGQPEEAIAIYESLLEDDPFDSGEVRFDLLTTLLRLKRDSEAESVLEDFEDMMEVYAEYARALLNFRKTGNSAEARRALKKAIKANPLAVPFLTGKTPIPTTEEDLDEGTFTAATLARENFQTWWSTPGAIDWLKKYGS